MTKLICFPHYTAGGLLCDILNDCFSPTYNGGIDNPTHHLVKIGDSVSVFTDFDHTDFMEKIQQYKTSEWIGTHCWPGRLPLHEFEKVICITTSTHRSRCYRWARSYYHQFESDWKQSGLDSAQAHEKMRETAKNYLIPFDPIFAPNVVNIEFSEIVENTTDFKRSLDNKQIHTHMQRWQQINAFLYESDFWTSAPVRAMHEAELEISLQRPYIYE